VAGGRDRQRFHEELDALQGEAQQTGAQARRLLQQALQVLASGPGLVATTLAELNPHNAAADQGLLERFAAVADAIG
jgi:hypothetical protein